MINDLLYFARILFRLKSVFMPCFPYNNGFTYKFSFTNCFFLTCLACPGAGGATAELPLSQPPQPTPPSSANNTLRTGSCPGTPEVQRRREEAVKRLAAKVRPKPSCRVSVEAAKWKQGFISRNSFSCTSIPKTSEMPFSNV